jgi:hypothetical protein
MDYNTAQYHGQQWKIFCGNFKAAGMYFATVTIVKRQKKHFIQQLSFRIDNVHLHLHALN